MYSNLLKSIFGGVWAIDTQSAEAYLPLVGKMISGAFSSAELESFAKEKATKDAFTLKRPLKRV